MTNPTTTFDPASQEANLRSEILQDAERKAKRIRERGDREAKKILGEVRADAGRRRETRLLAAQEQAEGRERAILASIEQEKKRRWLAARETVIDEVLKQAKIQAEGLTGDRRKQSLDILFGEALDALGETDIVVACPPADKDAAIEFARRRGLDATVNADAAIDGGVVVADASGRKRCDNSLAARLAGLTNQLRLLAIRRK